MELVTYDRNPFSVVAAEVKYQDLDQIAEWCKGELGTESTKLMGIATMLPVILVKGVGEARGKEFVARLGYFIVELNGSFRVYKPKQFKEAFTARKLMSSQPAEVFTPVSERTEFGDDAA